jgi:CRP-like cAMP-binding protein
MVPPNGMPPLSEASVRQQGVAMGERRQWLDAGQWLRGTSLFQSLSVSEAAVLGTFMERCSAASGETIVRQGEAGDDLYLIQAGQAEVQIVSRSGDRAIVTTLGPGDCFGEIALVTGGERSADVIALTPMSLMRLSRDAYSRYLSHLIEVDNQVTHTALTRVARRYER